MRNINSMSPSSGRMLKENNSVINIADKFEAMADSVNNLVATGLSAGGHEVVAVDDTVGGKALSVSEIEGMKRAFITAEASQMRFTLDGTPPTTTIGHLLNPGDSVVLDSVADLTSFRIIRTGAVNGSIQCTYSG